MKTLMRDPRSRLQRYLSRGILHLEMLRLPEALQQFRLAVSDTPTSAEAWFWMGRCQEDLGERAGAGYCYTFALGCSPRHAQAREGLRRLGYLKPDQDDPEGGPHDH
jgi:tetratricopeptide (TPR) repeat protein